MAQENNWRLIVIDKDGCRLRKEAPQKTCAEWNSKALEVISSYNPDLVVTLATATSVDLDVKERFLDYSVELWDELKSKGIEVIGMRDTPRFPHLIPECLEKNSNNFSDCSRTVDTLYDSEQVLEKLNQTPYISTIDMTDYICGFETCEPVVGNVIVYRDASHLTSTYVSTMTNALKDQLQELYPDFIYK